MQKMSVFTRTAFEVLERGGFMRSERQSNGWTAIKLYNEKGHVLPGFYNESQIVLDGMGLLRGTILRQEDGKFVNEWVHNPEGNIWDTDERSYAPSVYRS